jgi:hypothetical protein
MTKLSELDVHEMRCWILGSSSMLSQGLATNSRGGSGEAAYLHSLWMKAVWTLGWWAAGAAAEGAGMLFSGDGCSCCGVGGCRRSTVPPLTLRSRSGLLVAEAGADEPVGVVMSMGSPGDGVDIWMVGAAMMGIVLTPIDECVPSAGKFLGTLSVAAAICPGDGCGPGQRCELLEKTEKPKRLQEEWARRDRGGACTERFSRSHCQQQLAEIAEERQQRATQHPAPSNRPQQPLGQAYRTSSLRSHNN